LSIKLIKDIRLQTGASFGDCKKALSQANGDLEKAIEIASGMLKAQLNQENKEANAHAQSGAVSLLKIEFDKLTEIISDKTDPNRLRKVAELIINKYDLGLNEEEKKKYYVTSTLLSPLEKVPEDIKSGFIASYKEQKKQLLNSANSPELKNLETKIQDSITKQLQNYGVVNGQIDCLRFDPMLFSTTVDLTKGYNILCTDCKSINEVVETLLSDSWHDYPIESFAENGTDLGQLYRDSNGSFSIESESPDGNSTYYVATAAMKSIADGAFEQYGFKGQWEEVDAQELDKLTALKSKSNSASSDNLFLDIIELFINNI
tara:strand:- start:745 stop:1698 length:954 start_codon:yes stop_codon:yes gene_type:complete